MSWFTDAVGTVADAVADVVADVSDAATDLVETVGNGLEDGFGWLAGQADRLPWVGGFLGGVLRWLGRIVSGVFDLLGGLIKGISAILSGLLTGLIRIVGGIFGLDWSLILEGLTDIGSGFAGAFILIFGKLISLLQTVSYFLQPNERKLTDLEKADLKRVFHDSLALYNIRLVEGFAGVYSWNARPFVLGNTIYLKDRDVSAEPELLVHECVHVWQYHHAGARYTADALGAQWFGNEYKWREEIAEGRVDWVDFNKESQGKFLEDVYTHGELIDGHSTLRGDGVFYDADGATRVGHFEWASVDHTDRANDAVAALRAERSFRVSQFIG